MLPHDLRATLLRVDRRCRAAAEHFGVSYPAMLAHLAGIHRRTGIRPSDAIALGLADPQIPSNVVAACIDKGRLLALQVRLNPRILHALTEDKGFFYPFCEGHDLPVPKTYAVVTRDGGWVAPGRPIHGRDAWAQVLAETLPDQLVSKPSLGIYGQGVRVWRRDGDRFVDTEGRVLTAAGLHDALGDDGRYDSYVLQERLANHPSLARLCATPFLQTLRVTTLVDRRGEVHVLFAAFKIIVGENVTDNFDGGRTGNIAASVDLADGTLRTPVIIPRDGFALTQVPIHPRSGERLTGVALPFWDDAIALATRCARLFMPAQTFGWDIALTPSGARLVEGNRTWDPVNLGALPPATPAPAIDRMVAMLDLLRREAAVAPRPRG